MKARSQGKEFVVVTKVPKQYWRIPPLDARARLQELEREQEALQRLAEGTTPQGRELSRKLLFACERGLREGKSVPDMAVEIEPQMQESAMLRKEWSLWISRLWGFGFDELLEAHPCFFALFVAIIAAINIDRKKTMRVEAVRELVRRFPLLEDWEMNSLLGQVFAANPPLARLAAETLVRSRVGSGG